MIKPRIIVTGATGKTGSVVEAAKPAVPGSERLLITATSRGQRLEF